jgi:glutathione synthase/RimK-type ligase-like ATP-grasp enzyme
VTKPLPIGVFYEHQEWFRPLFAELDRRGTPYVPLDARNHTYDPASTKREFSLFFNRMSSSAYTRGNGQGTYYTMNYLAHLERIGTPVVNGTRAFAIESSKALQLSHLAALGLAFPRTIVINAADAALDAASKIGYPVIIKPNIGGAGAGIARYESEDELEAVIKAGKLDLGFHLCALVQEYVPPRDGHITRIETLDHKFLYAIDVYTTGESFNLCPADACQVPEAIDSAVTSESGTISRSSAGRQVPQVSTGFGELACPVEAVRTGLRVEAATPPAGIIDTVEEIVRAGDIDIGGVEYLIDERDGRLLFYDINALSNFVADATRIVGFDPHQRLVDYLERRAF